MISPTFVFVPGNWHNLTHLQPILAILHKRQYRTKSVQLHTVGVKEPRPCFSDDVSVIYTAVAQELLLGNDVCLVVHGYAGMPGAEAINRLVIDGVVGGDGWGGGEGGGLRTGKLRRFVPISAIIQPAGAVFDQRHLLGPENTGFSIDVCIPTNKHLHVLRTNDGTQETNMCHMSSPWHAFFSDLPLSLAKPFVDAVSATYYVGPAHLTSERWRTAPVTAVLCRKDKILSLRRQEAMWKPLCECEYIEACHTPYVTRPEEMAKLLEKMVEVRWEESFLGFGGDGAGEGWVRG